MEIINKTAKYRTRMKAVPRYHADWMDSEYKKYADIYIKNFKDGIKHNRFDIEPLKENTIKQKTRKGYRKPESPLFGLENEPRTLYNSQQIRKLKNGYKVYTSWKKHYKADLDLRHMMNVHEYGCIIKRGKTLIRIPARPVKKLAYEKTLRDIAKTPKGKDIKAGLAMYIMKGRLDYLQRLTKVNQMMAERILG